MKTVILLTLLIVFSAPVSAATLYASDTTSNSLHSISISDASSAQVGTFGILGSMAGLAYDPSADILYGTATGTDELFSIDRVTGTATLIGNLGVGLMHGLAFDSTNGKLFGSYGNIESSDFPGQQESHLYEIDTSTGLATEIGEIGFFFPDGISWVSGLAYDPINQLLYGSVGGPFRDGSTIGALITIDTLTGVGTLVAETERAINGLAFDADTGLLIGVDNGRGFLDQRLYSLNPLTGETTLIGGLGIDNPLGLEFAPAVVPIPTSIWLFASTLTMLGWLRRK